MLLSACSNNDEVSAKGLNKIRASAISETAVAYGAQYALAWRAKDIDKEVASQEKLLDKIYNFNVVVMDQNVLPPVLQKSDNSLNLSTPNAIRLSDSVIEIIMPARFITTPPSWRDYIVMDMFKKPEIPDSSVLPETEEERVLWDTNIKKGWSAGKAQAEYIFEEAIARLNRDFNGMSLYRTLYSQNMISAPFVSKADLGITGNGVKMRLGDKVVRITKPSELQINSTETWQPILLED